MIEPTSTREALTPLSSGGGPSYTTTLTPPHAAIVAAPQPYSAHNWLRSGVSAALLADIASGEPVRFSV